jgi:D-sedoheptulose 7-phosphate isomerase
MDDNWKNSRVSAHLQESIDTLQRVQEICFDEIIVAATQLAIVLQAGGKILLCGNGGSAADCQHMAAELVSILSLNFERPALAAIALTTDTSLLTAYSNDFGFEGVFERQVLALGKPDDALIGISTSGNSKNVVRAIKTANTIGMCTIALSGLGGQLPEIADFAVSVPSEDTQQIQEAHAVIIHILCDLIERSVFSEKASRSWLPKSI